MPTATQTAAAQGTANTSTAAAQAALNDVNQITPYGSTYYNQTGQYTDGSGDTVPTYTQTTSLSPMGQAILGGEQSATNTLLPAAQQYATEAAGNTAPLNPNTPYSATLAEGPQLLDQNTTNALYNEQTSFLNPQWQQTQQQLQDQLSRQGIPVGSQAYNNAETQEENAQTQAYQAAQDSAISGGTAAAGNIFNMAQAGQQQNLAQQQMLQQQPLSMLSQLFGATPATPSQPITSPSQASISPTDVTGATATSDQAAMNAYQAQLAQSNATTGAEAGTVGTLALAGAVAF